MNARTHRPVHTPIRRRPAATLEARAVPVPAASGARSSAGAGRADAVLALAARILGFGVVAGSLAFAACAWLVMLAR